jgi:GTP-binding protein
MLRKQRRRHVPVILVITKCDTDKMEEDAEHAFHSLGVGEKTLLVSAAHNKGTTELKETIMKMLKDLHFAKEKKAPEVAKEETEEENSEEIIQHTLGIPRIAIVGRPNVGKSSLVNALMSDPQREVSPKLVSDIPGTTRDATDTIIRHEGQDFIVVDTAGLRRKARIEEDLEGLSVLRTIQAIEDADVVVLLIEANETVSNQDKKIAGTVIERGKGLIILVNKIDLMKAEERIEKMKEARAAFPFCKFAPIVPVSAKTRENLPKMFDLALMAHRNLYRRIAPRELKGFLGDVIAGHPMSAFKSCKYVTQSKDIPPTFILFLRNPKKVQISQMRYIENRLRERFGLEGVPVKWITKASGGRK